MSSLRLVLAVSLGVLAVACAASVTGMSQPGQDGGAQPGHPDEPTDAGARPDSGLPELVDAGWPWLDAGVQGDGDFTIGPVYKDAPELSVDAGSHRGKIYPFTMSSSTSAIYPGLDGGYTRGVWVYVPSQYQDGRAAPLMIVQDGQGYLPTVTAALDTLIAAKQVPVMIVVFVNPGPGDGRGSERGLEYDTVSDAYLRFVQSELLPAVLADPGLKAAVPHLTFTEDPEGRASMGGSSGGAAAFTMGWFHPELYRRILTYSGTFVNQHPDDAYPHSAWEYHEHLIAEAPLKPLRVFLEAAQYDNDLDAKYMDGMHNWLTANRAMSAQLEAKGYHRRFLYALDAGHVDARVRRQTLPDALRWLWRGYPTQ